VLKKANILTRPAPADAFYPPTLQLLRNRYPATRLSTSAAAVSIQRCFSILVWIRFPLMAWMSPPLRASNEGFPKPRVARAQGTRRAIPPRWRPYSAPRLVSDFIDQRHSRLDPYLAGGDGDLAARQFHGGHGTAHTGRWGDDVAAFGHVHEPPKFYVHRLTQR
jgi:hypothetical protein